jgi:hypothetical protein
MKRVVDYFLLVLGIIIIPVFILKEPPLKALNVYQHFINKNSIQKLTIDSISKANLTIIDSVKNHLNYNLKKQTIKLYKEINNNVKRNY